MTDEKETELTDEQKDEAFMTEYKALCEKWQRGLSTFPAWRYSEDGRDFRMVINVSVARWNK